MIILFSDIPMREMPPFEQKYPQKINRDDTKQERDNSFSHSLFPPDQWIDGTIKAKGDHPFIQYLACSGKKVIPSFFKICCEPQRDTDGCREDYSYICNPQIIWQLPDKNICVVKWNNR